MNSKKLACVIATLASLLTASAGWTQPAGAAGSGVTSATPESVALPPTIPIFPLPNVVLFPNVLLELHIFEPRYRSMVADALEGDRIIGMVLLQPGYEAEYEGRPPIFPIGGAGIITDVQRLDDGRYNIVLRGLVKFRVNSEDESRPYRLARVDALPEPMNEAEKQVLRQHRARLEAMLAPPGDPSGLGADGIPDEDLVNGLAQHINIDPLERQKLLEHEGIVLRAQALIALLESLTARRLKAEAGRHAVPIQ
jgi:Lon protease-like protein